MKSRNTVKLHILDRDYTVACPPDAEPGLRAAADQLSERMGEIRSRGQVLGVDRVAVMAALNIIHELRSQLEDQTQTEKTITRITDRIDEIL